MYMKYSVRPVAFRPEWVEELGDMQMAVFFQQIHYWSDKGKLPDGWIFKTIEDFEYETTLTKDQQKRCRERLVSLGFIEVSKRKALFGDSVGAPVLHFRIIQYPANGLSGNPLMESRETRQSSITESTTESTTVSAKPKTFSNFRDQRRIETGRLPMLRAKKTIKSKKAWDELSDVDYEFKRYRGRAESKTGEDYSLLDDSLNPQMKRLMALAISKVNKKGKVMDDFYEYLFERSEYARKQKYNPLVCLTDRMLVDWQMESIKVKETLEDAALRIVKEERLRWPDDSDQARMSAANRFGEVSGILTTDPDWWEKIKPYRKLLGY